MNRYNTSPVVGACLTVVSVAFGAAAGVCAMLFIAYHFGGMEIVGVMHSCT